MWRTASIGLDSFQSRRLYFNTNTFLIPGIFVIYRINRTVIYNPDDGTLKLIDDDIHQVSAGEISLTPTANRLLHLLITHHGSVLQREELLENVWDNFGLKSSNNSLNQYISVLRRNFADLGLEELAIVTVPRIGFMFNQDLEIVTENTPAAADVAEIPEARHTVAHTPVASDLAQPPAGKRKRYAFTVIALLALLTVANLSHALYNVFSASNQEYEARYLIGDLQGCKVYSFYRASTSSRKALLDEVAIQLRQADLTCPPGNDIYYRIQDTLDGKSAPIHFVSVCYPLADDHYALCHSNYNN